MGLRAAAALTFSVISLLGGVGDVVGVGETIGVGDGVGVEVGVADVPPQAVLLGVPPAVLRKHHAVGSKPPGT